MRHGPAARLPKEISSEEEPYGSDNKYNDNVTVRFHSDIEKSFLGDVYAYIEDKAWLKLLLRAMIVMATQ